MHSDFFRQKDRKNKKNTSTSKQTAETNQIKSKHSVHIWPSQRPDHIESSKCQVL